MQVRQRAPGTLSGSGGPFALSVRFLIVGGIPRGTQ